jgi:hypothetical protein
MEMQKKMDDVISLGTRRELFVDHHVVDSMDGTSLKLHNPIPAGAAINYDEPWEKGEKGSSAFFTTVFQDGDTYRMYYRGHANVCYAESDDGIDWVKPKLGLVEVNGSEQNNIILGVCHNSFSPFLDTKAGVPSAQRYKATMECDSSSKDTSRMGLNCYSSSDGKEFMRFGADRAIPWTIPNHFDSQNVAFWSEVESQYVMYARSMVSIDGTLIDVDEYSSLLHDDLEALIARDRAKGTYIRSTARATSSDFLNWSQFTPMEYSDTDSVAPSAQLYTNQTTPYFRADHIYVSLPGRIFFGKLEQKSSREPFHEESSGDCSDGVLMTTRAGSHRYDFTFRESLLRPGTGDENWTTRNNYPAHGIIQTGESEMSVFVQRHYSQPTAHLERMTLRLDGFASLNALYEEGLMTTKPVNFSGSRLELNYSTSAAGSVRVGLSDLAGKPIDGFGTDDCDELVGDEISRFVSWKGSTDLSGIAGQTVRMRLVMNDADVFSFSFVD